MITQILTLIFTTSLYAIDDTSILEQDPTYKENNKKLEIILNASQNVGASECQSEAKELPRSASLWFNEGRKLIENEKRQFNLFNNETNRLKKKIQDIVNKNEQSNLQTASILIQAELLALEINYLSGKNGRIQMRKEFLTEFSNARPSAIYENKKWLETFDSQLINEGLKKSFAVAKKACEEKEIIKNCKEAQSAINDTLNWVLSNDGLKAVYLKENIPSKDAIDDLKARENKLIALINAIPANTNDNFDWKTPSQKSLQKMIEARKTYAVSCPTSKESKSQNKNVKIAEIFEDKNLNQEEKTQAMRKIDESIANALLGGTLTIEDLKRIPLEWDRQNLKMAEGHDREILFAEIEKMIQPLIDADSQKLLAIQEKRGQVLKMIMALGDLSSFKIDVDLECGANPHPGISVCPSTAPNPLCNPDSSESVRMREYNSCRNLVIQNNDQILQLGKASAELKNNPNAVSVEASYIGTVGPIWRVKLKNADGSFTYKNIVEAASQYGTDYNGMSGFGGVQNDPRYKATPAQPTSSTSNASASNTNANTNSTTNPNTTTTTTTTTGTAGITETVSEDTKLYNQYYNQLNTRGNKTPASVNSTCGNNPCQESSTEVTMPNNNSTCTVNDADKSKYLEFNACVKAVNEFNSKLDAEINLSVYIKNHPDFVGVARSPETNLWMAQMKNYKKVYYLPLNYSDSD